MSDYQRILSEAPKNWNRWGENDELGTLNFLRADEILRALRVARKGKVFSLGLLIGRKEGDLVDVGRATTVHLMTHDEGCYQSGKEQPLRGGLKFADDVVFMHVQGTTHIDALGHVWYGKKLYNGYDSDTTIGGLLKDSILPIAEKGIVARGVLLDVARYMRVDHLEKGLEVSLDDLKKTAAEQGVEIQQHDILLIRTGYIRVFYEQGAEAYSRENEPGITYSKELVDWFYKMEISALGSDTLSSEQSQSARTGTLFPLHIFLLNRLGIPIHEILWLEELANDCASDRQYEFAYFCSPLKFAGGTGSPVNPLAIK